MISNNVSNLLKPKTIDDLNHEIRDMSIFEFLWFKKYYQNKFNKFNKKVNFKTIGFKKKFVLLLLKYVSIHKFIFWPLFLLWISNSFLDLKFNEILHNNNIMSALTLNFVLMILVFISITLILSITLITFRFNNWVLKNKGNE